MKRFLDSSVLVESCLRQSPKFAAADALVNVAHFKHVAPDLTVVGV